MSGQHPDRDSLSAYIEESLSIDASQWIKQHLGGCAECRAKLEKEQAFLDRLHGLCAIKPPADFTQGVMARVAQYPAYQPVADAPWKRLTVWSGSAAAMLALVAVFVGWVLLAGSPGEGAQTSGVASSAVTTGAEWAKSLYFAARGQFEAAMPLFQIAGTILFGIFDFIRNSGLMVQLGLLLATVALNYAFTRMVLNYQRRQ